ncbi:hypothetical protein D6Z43_00005 (plasmid) [Pseudomonas sp. DY-1]|uniref:hypothetical protein n=1 Tax=Pseudomonas sp. DY-1 TaxID=1755504 RepID=UPI000EA8406F|nr:hypothetical protein [Pseudomonas sp. DY-1]AYF85669.1 hypothetical protein D6Z43_00005 [Pseudomonas sp. DY-1]
MGDYTGGGAIGGRTDPPGVVCQGSCQYAWDSAGPTNVYRFVDGTPNGVFGLFSYKGNGVSCSAEDSPNKGPSSLEAQSKSESSCTDKVTDGEGRVHMTCQTSSEYTNPGSCDRGQVNGETVCIPNSPSPSQQKTETEKEITEVTNPDGSKTTTTSETTTTTNCSGTKSCTTSVTNNTSVSHTNADGSKGDESSTCTGSGCKDGDGKSQDDKDKEKEEKEEDESVTPTGRSPWVIAGRATVLQRARSVFGDPPEPEPDPWNTIGQNLSHEHRMATTPEVLPSVAAPTLRRGLPGFLPVRLGQRRTHQRLPLRRWHAQWRVRPVLVQGNGVSCSAEDSPNKGPSSLEAQSKSESSCTDK